MRGVKEYLEKKLANIDELDGDIEVIKVNVQIDHVHLIMVIPPRLSVSSVVGYMKAYTGKRLKEKFGYLGRTYPTKSGIWSRGYCVSTFGMSEKVIHDYVEHQAKQDNGQLTFTLG